MNPAETKRPFYKEPMVWMIIAIPLVSVILGIMMITLAVESDDGLVVDDYYKEGMEINRTLARDARAAELELNASIRFSPADNRVTLRLTGRPSFEAPQEIKLGFFHATRQDEDQVLSLRRSGNGLYTAPMPKLIKGRWYVSAGTSEWRLTRAMYYPVHDALVLNSERATEDGPRT